MLSDEFVLKVAEIADTKSLLMKLIADLDEE